ncbi:MAG: DUF885 domain-containing protein [Gammaproteobacteria bacterium]|nr:DUF885 domain-containing protein [Gammaproteobacteria bacterium]
MASVLRFFFLSVLLLSPATYGQETAQQQIDMFFSGFTDRWMQSNPNAAVSTAYFDAARQNEFEQQLTPWTMNYRLARIGLAREGLAGLQTLELSSASPEQQLSAEVMQWQLESTVAAEPLLDYIDFPLNQFDGANNGLVSTFTLNHPFQDALDAENYLIRLRQVDDRMREATAESSRRMALGINQPAFILNATIEQMQRFIANAPQDNPLISTLVQKSADLIGLEGTRRDQLVAEAIEILEGEIYPAWQGAISQLESQLSSATDDAGLSRFANGAEIYQNRLEAYTSTTLTADEIHQIGLDEVARIEAEMETLFGQIGMTEGSIAERVSALRDRLAYPNTPEGRDALVSDIRNFLADALERSALLFDTMPVTPVIAQPFPEFMWPNAAASYSAAPLDLSRPAIFQMPLRENELTLFSKRSLVYHETVPGHHFQLALIGENSNLPRFMQMRAYGGIAAITEGWALYAERLAAESGWYEGDIEGHLGQLESALFRARRLVVDTGLHTKGWTRQQAIDYGIAPSEVERYVVLPGQACSYMIGQLKIVELRERARSALGSVFSIQEFHNIVLRAGVVPLTMLEAIVDEYIADTQAQNL